MLRPNASARIGYFRPSQHRFTPRLIYCAVVFTGLIEDVGRIDRLSRRSQDLHLAILPHEIDAATLVLGESIAVDGVCLTVAELETTRFIAVASGETLSRTTLGQLHVAARVNLERAVRAQDRLGGHLVSGHVDGVGEIASKRSVGEAVCVEFRAPRPILRYVVEKGSIAVDGISLTVNRVDEYSFAVMLIPHTQGKTTLGQKNVGNKVNLEIDMIAKYVEKFVKEAR